VRKGSESRMMAMSVSMSTGAEDRNSETTSIQEPWTSSNAVSTGRHWKMHRKVRTVPERMTMARVNSEDRRRKGCAFPSRRYNTRMADFMADNAGWKSTVKA
jgi:hypothetical protein